MDAENNTGSGAKMLERSSLEKDIKIQRGKNLCLFFMGD